MAKVVPCEVYSRVVGYFRPVHNWNAGKRAEFTDRKAFCEETSLKSAATKKIEEDSEQPKTVKVEA